MTQAIEKKTLTPAEYLESEIISEERHEYLNGEVKFITANCAKSYYDLAQFADCSGISF